MVEELRHALSEEGISARTATPTDELALATPIATRAAASPAPRISVCIPTYNGERYLLRTLESVLAQTLPDVEVIVVDDASTDGSVDVVRSLDHPRVRLHVHSKRLGIAGNWNRCLEYAAAPMICLFHQDDLMRPTNLEEKVRFLEENPRAGMVFSSVWQIGADDELIAKTWYSPPECGLHEGADFFRRLLRDGNIVCCPSVVARREVFNVVGPFDASLPFTLDWEMWLRVASRFPIGYLSEGLVSYRLHPTMETNRFAGLPELEQGLRASLLALDRAGPFLRDTDSLRQEVVRRYRREALQRASDCQRDENDDTAQAYLAFALEAGAAPGSQPAGSGAPAAEVGVQAPTQGKPALAHLRSVLRRGARAVGFGAEGPTDFYNSIPSRAEIETSFEYQGSAAPFADQRLFDDRRMGAILAELCEFAAEFTPAQDGDSAPYQRFFWNNGQFGFSDAMAYYCMVRRYRPATIVEVGCGFSTLIAAEALARNGSGRLVCIDPWPRPFLEGLPQTELVRQRAQDLDLDFYRQQLADGDMLVIDSTHTVKTGNDCVHLYLRVLPHLDRDVLVHAHDVFLPHPMPKEWLLQHKLFWTEQYLLLALMTDNPRVAVLYGSAYHNNNPATRPDLDHLMGGKAPAGGGSLWFEYRGRQKVPSDLG